MDEDRTECCLPDSVEYAVFFDRMGAALVDGILFLIVSTPIMFIAYGSYITLIGGRSVFDVLALLLTELLPVTAVIFFWYFKGATPGKLLMSIKIVDCVTGRNPSLIQSVLRLFGYVISFLSLGLGFLWFFFDKRKQGWQDKLSGTVVVSVRRRGGSDCVEGKMT